MNDLADVGEHPLREVNGLGGLGVNARVFGWHERIVGACQAATQFDSGSAPLPAVGVRLDGLP
jgi:hypothetical protein